MLIYIVEYVTRAHSSGHENRSIKTFSTLKASSAFLMKIFESFALDEDQSCKQDRSKPRLCLCEDVQDLYVDSRELKHAPKPTMELAEQLFSPAALQAFLDKPKNDNVIYGPWSQFCAQVPFEILFMESDVV